MRALDEWRAVSNGSSRMIMMMMMIVIIIIMMGSINELSTNDDDDGCERMIHAALDSIGLHKSCLGPELFWLPLPLSINHATCLRASPHCYGDELVSGLLRLGARARPGNSCALLRPPSAPLAAIAHILRSPNNRATPMGSKVICSRISANQHVFEAHSDSRPLTSSLSNTSRSDAGEHRAADRAPLGVVDAANRRSITNKQTDSRTLFLGGTRCNQLEAPKRATPRGAGVEIDDAVEPA